MNNLVFSIQNLKHIVKVAVTYHSNKLTRGKMASYETAMSSTWKYAKS